MKKFLRRLFAVVAGVGLFVLMAGLGLLLICTISDDLYATFFTTAKWMVGIGVCIGGGAVSAGLTHVIMEW